MERELAEQVQAAARRREERAAEEARAGEMASQKDLYPWKYKREQEERAKRRRRDEAYARWLRDASAPHPDELSEDEDD